ncbi:MAG: MarR family winged helix-turn-helix transcriptional regulator [Bacillota bacterium]|jgi:DNA-binding MarR family transcriptional regulator
MFHSNEVGYLIGKATRLIRKNINKLLLDKGITFPQVMVINYLYMNQKYKKDISFNTPGMIAKHLEYDRPTVTGILTRLEKQGWIIREDNAEDRRSQIIKPTEKSNELMQRFRLILDDLNHDILQGFQESEIRSLKKNLFKIIQNLEDLEL